MGYKIKDMPQNLLLNLNVPCCVGYVSPPDALNHVYTHRRIPTLDYYVSVHSMNVE